MFILTILTKNNCSTSSQEFDSVVFYEESLEEAIRLGQLSGDFYKILDLSSGRALDWDEINYKESEEWIYDDEELIWKKVEDEDHVQANFNHFLI
jgi:hypothetical protein